MKIKKKGNYLEIDGKLYKVTSSKGKEKFEDMEFEPAKENIDKLVSIIAKRLSKSISPEEILKNAMYDMEEEDIRKIYDKITKQKTKPKIKKNYGCLQLNVGGIYIPVRQ
jgi:uncharacterized protein YfkK (UPF0435 family)